MKNNTYKVYFEKCIQVGAKSEEQAIKLAVEKMENMEIYELEMDESNVSRIRNLNLVSEGLPDLCYVKLDISGEIVVVKKGEMGYYSLDYKLMETADELNAKLGISKAQTEAMLSGSMFGWDTPSANPANYDENGKFITI